MISTTAFDRLMQLGRQRGGLEIDDIGQALPIDTMTTTELADVLARLEEAGISLEIDPALLTPRHGKPIPNAGKAAERSTAERPTLADARLSSLASSIKAARAHAYSAPEPARPSVKMSGTVFVVAAALVLFLLALGAWHFT